MSYGRFATGTGATLAARAFGHVLVGVERFELPTSCSQSKRATRLRYTPKDGNYAIRGQAPKGESAYTAAASRPLYSPP